MQKSWDNRWQQILRARKGARTVSQLKLCATRPAQQCSGVAALGVALQEEGHGRDWAWADNETCLVLALWMEYEQKVASWGIQLWKRGTSCSGNKPWCMQWLRKSHDNQSTAARLWLQRARAPSGAAKWLGPSREKQFFVSHFKVWQYLFSYQS